ncbi:MAG TPA: hypothetical protein VG142_08055 [Trebonia sp.]|nr:hypothetical protein [Trebonia sp.]
MGGVGRSGRVRVQRAQEREPPQLAAHHRRGRRHDRAGPEPGQPRPAETESTASITSGSASRSDSPAAASAGAAGTSE